MKAVALVLMLLLTSLVGGPLVGRAAPLPAGLVGAVVLRDTACNYHLGLHWSILTDLRPEAERHPFTLAQVQALPYAARFVPSTEAIPNRETQPADYWLRCQVQHDGRPGTAWLLESALSNSRPFELYVVRDDGQTRRQIIDEEANWAASHAVPGRAQTVPLFLVPGRHYTLYVHIRNELFWFVIVEKAHFLQLNAKGDIEAAAYFGIMLGLLVYNLLLFFSVRDRSYFYYVLFTLFFALLQAHMMGYLTQFWLHRYSPLVQDASQHVLLGLTIVASVQTARSFLETRRLMPRYDRVLRWALLLSVFPVLSVWAGDTPLHYGPQVAPLAICAVLLVAGIWQLVAGYRPARYFMAGWTVLMVAIVVYYLRTLGVLPVSIYTEYGVRAASALEIILLSLGLADRINLTRQERQVAQREAFVALQEKEEVQQRANETLSQRAAELQTAYSELQASLQATGRLQELDELKTRFFTNISHELRTPLTLILAPLEEMLTGQNLQDPDANHALMHRHANRLLALINQLLDVARLEAGQVRLVAQPVNLEVFARLRVGAFASAAAQRKVRLELIEGEQFPAQPLYADADQLEKILDNLLSNALKFTPDGESIKVSLTYTEGCAEIRVADTGIGIAAAHLPHLFDRFYQADNTLQRQHEGSGIGLALVKELTELHHGTVSVSSAEGVGTAFVVRLPLGTAHLRPDEIREPLPRTG